MILIIDSILTPYCVGRYNAINDKMEGNLFVFFQSFTDINRHWKKFPPLRFRYEFLKDIPLRLAGKDIFTFHFNYDLPQKLNRLNPDKIIIVGWDSFASYYSAYWCRLNNKPLILWSGSTTYEPSWRRTIAKPLVRRLIQRCSNFIAYGTRAKDYLESLGAPEKRIQIFYNTVDVGFFEQESHRWKSRSADIKAGLGIKTSRVLLFNGQLIERKGIFELLEGFRLYQQRHPDWTLVYLGTGRAKEPLQTLIGKRGIPNVILAGFVEYDELPKYYAIADAFILPSKEEVWGLVINEAMACGLPIIANCAVGAVADLVLPPRNGYVMQKCSAEEIQNGLAYLEARGLLENNESSRIIQDFTLETILRKVEF